MKRSTSSSALTCLRKRPSWVGVTATKSIREDNRWKSLPILAMTANEMSIDRERCIATGMNDYITKPIDPKLLYEVMVKWIDPRDVVPPSVTHKKRQPLRPFQRS